MRSILSEDTRGLAEILHGAGQVREFTANEQIFAEGEAANYLPIVLSGRVKMVRYPAVGKEVIVSFFGEGEMFAVPPVFDGEPYPSTAIAMEDSSLLLIERGEFFRLLRESPDFSFAVIGWMCEMLREKTSTINNLSIASPEQRVGNVLLRLSDNQKPSAKGSGVKIELRRQDIAEMAGLTTETTIRAAKKLEERNLVKIVRGKIIVESPDVLRQFLRR